jgi:hypothetical protein
VALVKTAPGLLDVRRIDARTATHLVVAHHYMHRRPPISYAYGLLVDQRVRGVVTFGTPPSRHLQISACPNDPGRVIELNRMWVHDDLPRNSESWFVSRALKLLPPKIVVSYADTKAGHYGYVYRALNFRYAGWTDMERRTPRLDYVPLDGAKHSRDAYRGGYCGTVRRAPKVKYWTVTGNRAERRFLTRECPWPHLDWQSTPPPVYTPAREFPLPAVEQELALFDIALAI